MLIAYKKKSYDCVMEMKNLSNRFIRSRVDFDLIRRDKIWSGKVTDMIRMKYNRLKMDYIRSRTDQDNHFPEDQYNSLKIKG